MHRAGFAAIIGRPNVGKSTLLNRLLGEKLAIVTPKPQTTRNRLAGIVNLPERAQIVFIDTPGIHAGRGPLNRFMVEQAIAALAQVEVVVYVVEASRQPETFVLERAGAVRKPILLVMNKVDLVADKNQLLPRIEGWAQTAGFAEIIPICAASGDGVERVLDAVVARLPEAPPPYPEDQLTTAAERFLAAELIREQIFLLTEKEVPYATAVTIEDWQERAQQGDVVVAGIIHVERESQKPILVGRGGRTIKEIGTRARVEITKLIGRRVHLMLKVHVDPDWSRSGLKLRELGYA
jgi:GTP-binding protein Era